MAGRRRFVPAQEDYTGRRELDAYRTVHGRLPWEEQQFQDSLDAFDLTVDEDPFTSYWGDEDERADALYALPAPPVPAKRVEELYEEDDFYDDDAPPPMLPLRQPVASAAPSRSKGKRQMDNVEKLTAIADALAAARDIDAFVRDRAPADTTDLDARWKDIRAALWTVAGRGTVAQKRAVQRGLAFLPF